MELAAATHHSSPKGRWPDATHNALRGQKSASSVGARPVALREPVPQLVSEHAACPCSSGAPPLSMPILADRAADGVDSSSLRFPTASALEARRKEEEEKKEQKRKDKELEAHLAKWGLKPVPKGSSSFFGPMVKRKRKKRRKKRLPPHALYALGNLDVLPRAPCLPGHVLCLVTCSCVSHGGLLLNFTQFLRAVTLRCLGRLGNTVVWGLLDSGYMRCVSLAALFAPGYGHFSTSSCTLQLLVSSGLA